MEYQGKELFRRAGIPVPQSRHALAPHDVAEFLETVAGEWVVKAQVLMGGRGKAGKIKFAQRCRPKGAASPKRFLRRRCRRTVRIPRANRSSRCWSKRSFRLRRKPTAPLPSTARTKKPAIIVSRFGGMDIEEVSEKHPESIAKFFVDTAIGYSPFIGRELAFEAELDPGYPQSSFPRFSAPCTTCSSGTAQSSWKSTRWRLPPTAASYASDAKVELDDDALFRNPEFAQWQQALPLDEDERLAAESGLGIRNFRRFDGTVGTMANGAGLAMATMDAVSFAGGKVANFPRRRRRR